VLDTVISLRRPDGYEPTEGARFEVHFEKSRGFTGADAVPFEASLQIAGADGAISWQTTDLNQDEKAAAFEWFEAGRKPPDAAKQLGIHRATAYRWHKEWKK
jgi:putative DNA primase/helicase